MSSNMFSLLLTILLLTPLFCNAASSQDKYRTNYTPQFTSNELGSQIVSPDDPYVAASGPSQLYFIDPGFDAQSAAHIKQQIERANVPQPDEYISIDGTSATAEIKNADTNETVFTFDAPYARLFFADDINRENPQLDLPVHPQASNDSTVTYTATPQQGNTAVLEDQGWHYWCTDYGCGRSTDCLSQTRGYCKICSRGRVDDVCREPRTPPVVCRPLCTLAVDEPRKEGETDRDYYKRMDELHFGGAGEGGNVVVKREGKNFLEELAEVAEEVFGKIFGGRN